MDQQMHPHFYSFPLQYLNMFLIESFGRNAKWKQVIAEYPDKQMEKILAKKLIDGS